MCDRECSRDDGLRGNNGGNGGHDQDGPIGHFRHHHPERVGCGGAVTQNQGSLAQIVQRQTRQNKRQPAQPDGRTTEMAHVGIEGFCPGHGQEDAAQDDKAEKPVVQQEQHPVMRRQGPEDREIIKQMIDSHSRQDQEPQGGQRSKEFGYTAGATRLDQEQANQNARRDRQDKGIQASRQPGRVT